MDRHLKALAAALTVPAAIALGYYFGEYIPLWAPLGLIMLAVYATVFVALSGDHLKDKSE